MKKKKGFEFITSVVVTMIVLIPIIAIIITFLNVGKDAIRSVNIESVTNEYMLRMESKGYLNSQDEIELKQELENIGVESIDLTGTTRTNIGYSKSITLKIKGIYKVKVLDVDGVDKGNKYETTPIDITRRSVSKN